MSSIDRNQVTPQFSGSFNESRNFVVTVQWGDRIHTLTPLEIKIGDRTLRDEHKDQFKTIAEEVYKLYEECINSQWETNDKEIVLDYGFTGKLNEAASDTEKKVTEATKNVLGNESKATDKQIKAIDTIANSILCPGEQSGSDEVEEGTGDTRVDSTLIADQAAVGIEGEGTQHTNLEEDPTHADAPVDAPVHELAEQLTETIIKQATVNHTEGTLAATDPAKEQEDGTGSIARGLRNPAVQAEVAEEADPVDTPAKKRKLEQAATDPTADTKEDPNRKLELARTDSTPANTEESAIKADARLPPKDHPAAPEIIEQETARLANDTPAATNSVPNTEEGSNRILERAGADSIPRATLTISPVSTTALEHRSGTSLTPGNDKVRKTHEAALGAFETAPEQPFAETKAAASQRSIGDMLSQIQTNGSSKQAESSPLTERQVRQEQKSPRNNAQTPQDQGNFGASYTRTRASSEQYVKAFENQDRENTYTQSTRPESSKSVTKKKVSQKPTTTIPQLANEVTEKATQRNSLKTSSAPNSSTVKKPPSRASTPSTGRTSSSDSEKTPLKGLPLGKRREAANAIRNAGNERYKKQIEDGKKAREKAQRDKNTASRASTPSTSRTGSTSTLYSKREPVNISDVAKKGIKNAKSKRDAQSKIIEDKINKANSLRENAIKNRKTKSKTNPS